MAICDNCGKTIIKEIACGFWNIKTKESHIFCNAKCENEYRDRKNSENKIEPLILEEHGLFKYKAATQVIDKINELIKIVNEIQNKIK